jgi:hypothetical protein
VLIRKDLTGTAAQIPLSRHGCESRPIAMDTAERRGRWGFSMSVRSAGNESTSLVGKLCLSGCPDSDSSRAISSASVARVVKLLSVPLSSSHLLA